MSDFIECSLEKHGGAILAIFNHAIKTTTALYDYEPRPIESMTDWFAAKQTGGFPIIGLEGENGELMGFASYGKFRPQQAYLHTAEHSVYVHPDHRGKGLGRQLLAELINRAKAQGLHLLVGLIDSENATSIQLHKSLGFTHSGTIQEAGYKFERWLDVDIYQLKLLEDKS